MAGGVFDHCSLIPSPYWLAYPPSGLLFPMTNCASADNENKLLFYIKKKVTNPKDYMFVSPQNLHIGPDVAALTCNPRIWEAEAGGSMVPNHPGLHSETVSKAKQELQRQRQACTLGPQLQSRALRSQSPENGPVLLWQEDTASRQLPTNKEGTNSRIGSRPELHRKISYVLSICLFIYNIKCDPF